MKVGMIQSNYLPWRGYFDFMDDVDLFIFYDDVQYTHRDWRNRNKIKTSNGTQWISVPVIHNNATLICNAEIDYSQKWIEKHIKSITLAYTKADYFEKYSKPLFDILHEKHHTISALNISLIKWVMGVLDINTEIRMSSEFGIEGDKYKRPLNILKKIGATEYLSGPTAKEYTNEKEFIESGISLEYKTYDYIEYPQLWGPYQNNVSIIDLIFNCGQNAKNYFKSLAPALEIQYD